MTETDDHDEILFRRIGTIDIAVLEEERALASVAALVAARKPRLVCFANAHTVNTARADLRFADALRRALILNDGIGVDLASRWIYGTAFPANLNGTDFTPALIERLPVDTRLFLLGGAPGIVDNAATAIVRRHPHVRIAGTQHGFFAEQDNEAAVGAICDSGADLVLVAMGHPRQEIWAARHFERIGVPMLCVGALLDFYSGKAVRAPALVRRLRLEWAFRLSREPRRLARRYLIGNATFLAHVLRSDRIERCYSPLDASNAG